MRFRLHGVGAAAFALTAALGILTAEGAAQTANNRKPPEHRQASRGGIIPMPPDRADDSYAIYSLLMPGPTLAHLPAEQGAPWAIAEVTVNEPERNPSIAPQGQLKPPPDHPKPFREAVEDYEANRYTRVQLDKDRFHISHAFELVNPDTAKTSGYAGVTYFSEVYFDVKHDAALVYQSEWCANLCSSGTWIYLEKQGGQWVRRSGIVVPGA
jgi:hypothetical protein